MHKIVACFLVLVTLLGSISTEVLARDVMTVSEYVQALLIAEGNTAEPNRVSVPIDDIISQQRMTELFPSRFGGNQARIGIVPASGGLTGTVLVPNVDLVESFDNTWQNSVSFIPPGGAVRAIDSRRYRVDINGVWYEAFCADPHLLGPNVAPVPYTIRHASSDLLTVLRYGFPHNPAWTDSSENFFLSDPYASYITRVAVAAANWLGQGGNLDGDPAVIVSAMQLVNGENWVNAYYARGYLRIAVNGQESANTEGSPDGGMVVSGTFNLTHPNNDSPVMFVWPAGTPSGAVLLDSSGNEIAVGQPFTGDRSFRIAVPQGTNSNNVTVEIIGINNDYAGQVWTSRIQNDNAGFQDIVFYIPEVMATASMTSTTTMPTPTPNPGPTPTPMSLS